MTEKPILIDSTWANYVNDLDPTGPEYAEIIERPPQAKFESGWLFGEKPSHKYWNYNWKNIDDYVHHINNFGIPEWDEETNYEIGSIVLVTPYLYKALTANQNVLPEENPSDWQLMSQFLADLLDVDYTAPSDDSIEQLLVYDSQTDPVNPKWVNENLDDVLNSIKLDNLYDVNIASQGVSDVLSFNEETEKWENKNLREIARNDLNSTVINVKDIHFDIPEEGDVLKYDGGIWRTTENIKQVADWDYILNKPNEYQPPMASASTLGGAKVYSTGSTLHIKTEPEAAPFAPENLNVIVGNSTLLSLYWSPASIGELSYYYNVYRDSLHLQKGVLDNVYYDDNVVPDREYYYTVTAVNQHGESGPSNQVMGHTFTEPSPPRNLTYSIKAYDVELTWDIPDHISGSIVYDIYKDGNNIGDTTTRSYIDKGLAQGVYSYFVVARNKYYNSNNSNVVTVIVR